VRSANSLRLLLNSAQPYAKMPPKKAQRAAAAIGQKQKQTTEEEQNKKHEEEKPFANDKAYAEVKEPSPRKRKTPPTKAAKLYKEPRRATKSSSRGKSAPTQHQLVRFLLSPKSLPLCYPKDELDAPESKKYSTTSPSDFSPFEHLITASLLSKPLSHTLGMRSTRTLLNPPFSLNTPKVIAEAGEKRVWEALEAARTQHRQKTASYVFQMGQYLAEDPELEGLKEDPINEVQKLKGIGKTGAELFCRSVQCLDNWEVFPFADQRSLEALKELGLNFEDAEDLQELLEKEVDWKQVDDMGLGKVSAGSQEQKRVAFVLILERGIGASLEGNIQVVRNEAAALPK
jgi:hypothetical protein